MANSFENEREAIELETLSSLAVNLVYRLPGCPDLIVRKTLDDVYRDFCRRSCSLRARRHLLLHHHECEIQVPPMFGGITDSVTFVTWRKRRLDEHYDYTVIPGNPPSVRFDRRYVPGHCERDLPEVYVESVEIPKIGSERAPRWFLSKYGEYIVSGVLARLMSMSGKQWSDGAQAQVENIRYENAVSEARMDYYAGSDSGDFGHFIDTGDLL